MADARTGRWRGMSFEGRSGPLQVGSGSAGWPFKVVSDWLGWRWIGWLSFPTEACLVQLTETAAGEDANGSEAGTFEGLRVYICARDAACDEDVCRRDTWQRLKKHKVYLFEVGQTGKGMQDPKTPRTSRQVPHPMWAGRSSCSGVPTIGPEWATSELRVVCDGFGS